MINEYGGGGDGPANDNVDGGNDNAGADANDWGAGGGTPNEAGAVEVGDPYKGANDYVEPGEAVNDNLPFEPQADADFEGSDVDQGAANGSSALEAGNEAAQREPEQKETASSDFVLPRAANDDVAGTKHDPSEGIPVIGRRDDTLVARGWEGHAVIDLRANPNANEIWVEAHERGDLRPLDGRPVTEVGWSPELNEDWIRSIVDNRAIVYLGSEPAGDNLLSDDHKYGSVFSSEINQLQDAGYRQVGNHLVPEELAEAFANRNRPPSYEE